MPTLNKFSASLASAYLLKGCNENSTTGFSLLLIYINKKYLMFLAFLFHSQ